MEPSDAIETSVKKRAEKLEQFHNHIMACRVTIEAPHKHQHKGKLYNVRVDVTVPEGELVATRAPNQHHAHEDVYVAIRDSFNAVRRQLDQHLERRRKRVKNHDAGSFGRIVELFPHMDYGTIVTPDAREIYFHRNSLVTGELEELTPGVTVRFVEEAGDEGPQASSVVIEGKHHRVG
jgi:ribosomal subunit interface protein